MLKNTFFSVFSKKGGDTVYLCMVSDFKKCEKQNPVENFPVTEYRGWILLWTAMPKQFQQQPLPFLQNYIENLIKIEKCVYEMNKNKTSDKTQRDKIISEIMVVY